MKSSFNNPDSLLQKDLFYIIAAYITATYLAFSIHFSDFLPIRFLRIPLLIGFLIYFFKSTKNTNVEGSTILWLKRGFLFLIIYMFFNAFAGLNALNSLLYIFWLVISFIFFYLLLLKYSNFNITSVIYSIALGFALPGLLFIIISLIGGYILGIPLYFDIAPDFISGGETIEFAGIFGNPNTLAMVTFTTLSSSLILASHSASKKFLWAIITILLIGLQIHIGSRTGIFCAVITISLYILIYKRNIYYIMFLVVPILVYGYNNIDSISKSINTSDFDDDKKFGNRTELIDDAFRISNKMDILGTGYGNQRIARERYSVTTHYNEKGELNFHNTFLALWIELGYLGLTLFLIPVIVILGKSIYSALFTNNDYREYILLLLSVTSTTIFFGFAEDSINMAGSPVFSYFWIFFLLIAILLDKSNSFDETNSVL